MKWQIDTKTGKPILGLSRVEAINLRCLLLGVSGALFRGLKDAVPEKEISDLEYSELLELKAYIELFEFMDKSQKCIQNSPK